MSESAIVVGVRLSLIHISDRKKLLEQFLLTVETQEPVTQFDERRWSSLVDFVTVYSEKDIRVTFKDGTEIQV